MLYITVRLLQQNRPSKWGSGAHYYTFSSRPETVTLPRAILVVSALVASIFYSISSQFSLHCPGEIRALWICLRLQSFRQLGRWTRAVPLFLRTDYVDKITRISANMWWTHRDFFVYARRRNNCKGRSNTFVKCVTGKNK